MSGSLLPQQSCLVYSATVLYLLFPVIPGVGARAGASLTGLLSVTVAGGGDVLSGGEAEGAGVGSIVWEGLLSVRRLMGSRCSGVSSTEFLGVSCVEGFLPMEVSSLLRSVPG